MDLRTSRVNPAFNSLWGQQAIQWPYLAKITEDLKWLHLRDLEWLHLISCKVQSPYNLVFVRRHAVNWLILTFESTIIVHYADHFISPGWNNQSIHLHFHPLWFLRRTCLYDHHPRGKMRNTDTWMMKLCTMTLLEIASHSRVHFDSERVSGHKVDDSPFPEPQYLSATRQAGAFVRDIPPLVSNHACNEPQNISFQWRTLYISYSWKSAVCKCNYWCKMVDHGTSDGAVNVLTARLH